MESPDTKLEHVLAILGALVPLASAVASLLNHMVRAKRERGEDVSPLLLHAGSVLNVASVNLDKAVQLGKLARSPKAPKKKQSSPTEETPALSPKCPACGAQL